jgi:hypothetical protein
MMTTTSRVQAERNEQPVVAHPSDRRDRRWFRRSVAGIAVGGGLLVLATAMMGNANFSDRYITDQLSKQRITFKAADALTEAERSKPCVVANAGKPMLTGKQAECYANDFIGTHIQGIGRGRTYAEMEDVRNGLLAQIATAQANGDPELPKLQKELGELTGQREALFKAEMLRGTLLTSFGFSTLGEKAGQAATVAYGAAGLVLALSLGGLVYGARAGRRAA